MSSHIFRQIVKISAYGVAIIVFLFVLVEVVKFHPQVTGSVQSNSGYPAPNPRESATSTSNLCDKWFAYRTSLPNSQKAMVDKQYEACLAANRFTPDPSAKLATFTIPPQGTPFTPFFQRSVDGGTIIESGSTNQPSEYLIENEWFTKIDDKTIIVSAGAQRFDPVNGGLDFDKPLPGIVIVSVASTVNGILPSEGGQYLTPIKGGPVRIVDGEGTILFLVSEDGETYAFDVMHRIFTVSPSQFTLTKAVSNGSLVESSRIPINFQSTLGQYKIQNYWFIGENNVTTILAGAEISNDQQGALILINSSANALSIKSAIVFLTPLICGPVRIVDVNGDEITLVSDTGVVFSFNYITMVFTIVPAGSSSVSENIQLTPGAFPMTLSTSTSTPRPIPTALPTLGSTAYP